MKKIGIITFHKAINYGAVLQCYALQTILKKMEYDVTVIDYNPSVMQRNRRIFNFSDFIMFLYSVKMAFSKVKAIIHFNNFLRKHLTITPFEKIVDDNYALYDTIVIGSDQLWSPRINSGYDEVYWGNFNKKIKKITYAISMGTDHTLDVIAKEKIRKYAENFNAISVREHTLREELFEIGITKKIEKVLDPTLLLCSEDYDVIATTSNKYGDYILYYEIRHDPSTISLLYKLAKYHNCKIVSLLGPRAEFDDVEYIRLNHGDVSIEYFLGLIKHSKCVVTSSFHGTSFSIIFRKDFYSLVHKDCDRARDLLTSISLSERLVSPKDVIKIQPVDYDISEELLLNQIKTSMFYLKDNIN